MSQPCPYCGNRGFEEEDGILVCDSCGRQQEGGLQVADDDAEFGTQGRIARRKIEKTKAKITKIYRGSKAYKLYLEAWQHIMWRQSYAMIHGSAKAPSELWTVARDLWTLRLSNLLHQIDEEAKEVPQREPTTTTDHEAPSAGEAEETQKHINRYQIPKLWDSIALVYLAALLVRYPISLSAIYSLIRTEEVPFIRAIRFVPYDMTSHLPSEYQLALDTVSIPQAKELQQAAFGFIQSFASEFSMEVPALNWRVLLYEWIVELGIPLDLYETVKSLANMLKYDFIYNLSIETSSRVDLGSERRKHRRTPIAMPELQLMSLVVVATKLLFPPPIPDSRFSEASDCRLETSSYNPPTHLTLDWAIWLSLHKSYAAPGSGPAKHIETTDRDVMNMSPEEMDDYMAWYQRTFSTPDTILRHKKTDLEMSILDMFPAPEPSDPPTLRAPQPYSPPVATPDPAPSPSPPPSPPPPHPQTPLARESLCKKIQALAVQYTATPTRAIYPIFPSIDTIKSSNTLFRTAAAVVADIDGDTDEHAGSENNPIMYFHELAARVACTDVPELLRAVRYTEGRVEEYIGERRRSAEEGRGGEAPADSGDVYTQ